jgi:methylmalonyl-CoA mutase
MEVAKMRAARLIWAKLMKGSTRRTPSPSPCAPTRQTSGWSLTAQDVFNNVIRTCGRGHGGHAWPHPVAAYQRLDEALALPTDFSARIARNTQLFLQTGSGHLPGDRSLGRQLLCGAADA